MSTNSDTPVCSVIIPTYNEEKNIGRLLESLINCKPSNEIIIVDGGSTDNTKIIIQKFKEVSLLESEKGRARQMNLGAENASYSPLVFLHADTSIPASFTSEIENISSTSWGYFNIRIASNKKIFRIIEFMMNLRCRLTNVITGDMTLSIGKDLFNQVAGFPDLSLMEDIAISKNLRKTENPRRLPAEVTTSARRWEKNGIYSTIFLMWRLRLSFLLQNDQTLLNKKYEKQNK